MAITIVDSPQLYMPAYNNIVWTVSSTNKTKCNFRFICDIYINGVYKQRLKLFPAGTNGYASFKVNRVIEDFVSHDLQNNLFGFGFNTNSACGYTLHFGEEYDNSAGCDVGTTVYPDLTTGTASYAFNCAIQYKDLPSWVYTDYTAYTTSKKMLTKQPDYTYIGIGQQSVINFLNIDATKFNFAQILTYTSADNFIGMYKITNPYVTPGTDITKLVQSFGVGPDNLNNATLSTGSQPVIGVSVHHYSVQLLNSALAATSPLIWFNIENRTSVWEPYRIWWLNRLGGFDSYAFTMKSTKVVNSSRVEMQKLLGGLNGTPDWTYTVGDRGRTTVSVDASETNTYTSNWLTQQEATWLEELFTSPEVYMSRVNEPVCYFSSASANAGASMRFYFNGDDNSDITKFKVGDSVFFYSLVDPGTYGAKTVEAVNYATLPHYVQLNLTYDASIITENGYISLVGATSVLDPVIIKSTSYTEKSKHNTKNINYEIQVEKAYPINIQRN